MVAQQNMLLLDLFHNRERREISTSTVFSRVSIRIKCLQSASHPNTVSLTERFHPGHHGLVLKRVLMLLCPNHLKHCLFHSESVTVPFDRHTIVLEKTGRNKGIIHFLSEVIIEKCRGAAVDRRRPVSQALCSLLDRDYSTGGLQQSGLLGTFLFFNIFFHGDIIALIFLLDWKNVFGVNLLFTSKSLEIILQYSK